MKKATSESLGSFFQSLSGAAWTGKVLESPPDIFGLAGSVLTQTGAYLAVVSKWPPEGYQGNDWQLRARQIGRAWANGWRSNKTQPPQEVRKLWREIVKNSDVRLSAIRDSNYSKVAVLKAPRANRVCRALLEVMAIADEACSGLGIPRELIERESLHDVVATRLYEQYAGDLRSTLCRFINREKLLVLPKLHTPQTGITIRSLSHNLSLCFGEEVRVSWIWGRPLSGGESRHGLNILVIPWPDMILPADFSPTKPRHGQLSANARCKQGFFCFKVSGRRRWDLIRLRGIITRAYARIGLIDALVFPELSMTEAELKIIAGEAIKIRPTPPMIIAGIAIPHKNDLVRNVSVTLIPYELPTKRGRFRYARFEQHKHHRWKLDSRQIQQYGIGGVLDPCWSWWENSILPRRKLSFISVNRWLTMCTLLCEDLARPDPIADIVRAVGPNLVIALLMDGPQLAGRWPARYGTVLADDPGSSVLTVTSLGMAESSWARDLPVSRVVALWKDAQCGAPLEITLPKDKEAIILCVTKNDCTEFTADGRDDESAAAHLNLSGIHTL